jgi:hypothetical protein
MWIMLMSNFDLTLSIVLGIVLAAATCFRVFLPMLIASAAAYAGHLPLDDNFAWLATPAVLIMLSVAALVEIIAYYIPGIDNLLDIMAAPAGLVAGTVLSAAVMTDLPSILKWTAAIVAGGGAAGLTQNLTTMLRAKSTVFTGGVGNSVIATAELGGVFLIPLLALAAPLIAFALALVLFWLAIRLLRWLRQSGPHTIAHRHEAGAVPQTSNNVEPLPYCVRGGPLSSWSKPRLATASRCESIRNSRNRTR